MFKLVVTTAIASSAAHRFRCNPSRMPQTAPAPEDTLPFEAAPGDVYGSVPDNLDDFMPAESIPTPSATRYDEGIVGDPLMIEEDMMPTESVFSAENLDGPKPCSKSNPEAYPGSSTLEEGGEIPEIDNTAAFEDGADLAANPENSAIEDNDAPIIEGNVYGDEAPALENGDGPLEMEESTEGDLPTDDNDETVDVNNIGEEQAEEGSYGSQVPETDNIAAQENGDMTEEQKPCSKDGSGPETYSESPVNGEDELMALEENEEIGASKPCADTETAEEFADDQADQAEDIETDEFKVEGDVPKPCKDKSGAY